MNGVRSTFMRRGYLLTALSALLLLAASSGTASAQSIGFEGSSGSVSETASLETGAFEGPNKITIKASGFRPGTRVSGLEGLALRSNGPIRGVVLTTGANGRVAPKATDGAIDVTEAAGGAIGQVVPADFMYSDEVVLLVVQGENGIPDTNWHDEQIRLSLTAGPGVAVSPANYTVTVEDHDPAPVAKFNAPSFTLTEGSQREVNLDIVSGGRPGTNPPAAISERTAGTDLVTIQVSNSQMVGVAETGGTASTTCGGMAGDDHYGKAVVIELAEGEWNDTATAAFARTGRLRAESNIATLGGAAAADATLTFKACSRSNFRDAQVTLTILSSGLHEPASKVAGRTGDVTVGDPLMVTLDSDDAAPTLSFTLTDVTIDEGQSINTVLIAEGTHATDVGQVKLMVEGDAMIDLYHEDTMLEEMNGYVTVDLGNSNQARLMAMSREDRGLEDGQTAYKAWKLVDGSSDAMIGDDSWFRVDVRGLTAVPALPLIGQLLLALFLMAGGSRLYRRRRD